MQDSVYSNDLDANGTGWPSSDSDISTSSANLDPPTESFLQEEIHKLISIPTLISSFYHTLHLEKTHHLRDSHSKIYDFLMFLNVAVKEFPALDSDPKVLSESFSGLISLLHHLDFQIGGTLRTLRTVILSFEFTLGLATLMECRPRRGDKSGLEEEDARDRAEIEALVVRFRKFLDAGSCKLRVDDGAELLPEERKLSFAGYGLGRVLEDIEERRVSWEEKTKGWSRKEVDKVRECFAKFEGYRKDRERIGIWGMVQDRNKDERWRQVGGIEGVVKDYREAIPMDEQEEDDIVFV